MSARLCYDVAEVRRHVSIDTDPDLSYLEQFALDDPDAETREGARQDRERLDAYNGGRWFMVGVYVTLHDPTGKELERSGGLWGIESDSGDDYFASVAEEEVSELATRLAIDLSGYEVKAT